MIATKSKKKVLFICTQNSVRSQIAEGILRSLYGDGYEAFSAGTKLSTVNPYTIRVLHEIDIDISNQRSKSIDELTETNFDYIVTVCDHAQEVCPFFSGDGSRIHKGFEDPAGITGTEETILDGFRQIRDEVMDWIRNAFVQNN
jgi:arsenate reductase